MYPPSLPWLPTPLQYFSETRTLKTPLLIKSRRTLNQNKQNNPKQQQPQTLFINPTLSWAKAWIPTEQEHVRTETWVVEEWTLCGDAWSQRGALRVECGRTFSGSVVVRMCRCYAFIHRLTHSLSHWVLNHENILHGTGGIHICLQIKGKMVATCKVLRFKWTIWVCVCVCVCVYMPRWHGWSFRVTRVYIEMT